MGLIEVLRYLEEEKERLLAGAADVRDLYRSLAESIRTLSGTLPAILRARQRHRCRDRS